MNENPYKAPATAVGTADEQNTSGYPRRAFFWAAIFAANMIMPIAFGSTLVAGDAVIGMWATVLSVFVLGLVLCTTSPQIMKIVTTGSVITALSQFIPVLQFVAGLIAIALAEAAGLTRPPNDFEIPRATTMTAGAFITVVSGSILLFSAGLLGWGWHAVLKWRAHRRHFAAPNAPPPGV